MLTSLQDAACLSNCYVLVEILRNTFLKLRLGELSALSTILKSDCLCLPFCPTNENTIFCTTLRKSAEIKSEMRSFKSNENIHKKDG